jgi:hypothetical protein
LRCDLLTDARLAQGISAGVEAAVLSRTRLDLRVKTRAATLHAAKIDCLSFGNRLFSPFYRLPNADEFSAFPPISAASNKMQSMCEIDCEIQSNP